MLYAVAMEVWEHATSRKNFYSVVEFVGIFKLILENQMHT